MHEKKSEDWRKRDWDQADFALSAAAAISSVR